MNETSPRDHAAPDDRVPPPGPVPHEPDHGGPVPETAPEQAAVGQTAYNRPPSSTDPAMWDTPLDEADEERAEDDQGRQTSRP